MIRYPTLPNTIKINGFDFVFFIFFSHFAVSWMSMTTLFVDENDDDGGDDDRLVINVSKDISSSLTLSVWEEAKMLLKI